MYDVTGVHWLFSLSVTHRNNKGGISFIWFDWQKKMTFKVQTRHIYIPNSVRLNEQLINTDDWLFTGWGFIVMTANPTTTIDGIMTELIIFHSLISNRAVSTKMRNKQGVNWWNDNHSEDWHIDLDTFPWSHASCLDAAVVLVGRTESRTALAVVFLLFFLFFFFHKGPKLHRDLEYYVTVQQENGDCHS